MVITLKAWDKADGIRALELEKAYKAIQKGEATEAVIESLARNLTNKLIHSPSVQMKRASAEGREEMLEHVRDCSIWTKTNSTQTSLLKR